MADVFEETQKTVTERILDAAGGRNLSEEAVNTAMAEAENSSLVNKYLEKIVAREDFPEQYGGIFAAIGSSQNFDVNDDKAAERILDSDIDYELMQSAFAAASNEHVYDVHIEHVFNTYAQCLADGMDEFDAGKYAADMFTCMSLGYTALFAIPGGKCEYTPEQVEAVASACSMMNDFADFKEAEFYENTGRDLPENYLRGRLYDVMNYAGGFRSNLTPDQIKGIGECVTEMFRAEMPKDWNGRITYEQADAVRDTADIIRNHDTCFEVYDTFAKLASQEKDMKPAEIWDEAKHNLVDKEISRSYEAVNNDDPIPGLKRICEKCGLSPEDTEMIAEAAIPKINQNMFLKEHDAENLAIRRMADMLVEGIPPKDAVEYSDLIGTDSRALAALYDMKEADMPKDVTRACIVQGLDPVQRSEVIAARDNGVEGDALLNLCQNIPPADLCKERLKAQNALKDNVAEKLSDFQKNVKAKDGIDNPEKNKVHSGPSHDD